MRSLFMFPSFVALFAVGCAAEPSPEESQLESALHTWSVHGPSQYSFTWQRSCECTTDTVRPIRITVAGDAITSAVYVDDQTPVSTEVRAGLLTIDGVFDEIAAAIQQNAHSIAVEYDANSGHPISVGVDYSAALADEELALTIKDLVSNVERGAPGGG